MIKIAKTNCNFEREPLSAPFGFKGKYIDELWQTAALVEDLAGNSIMFLLTEYALQKAKEISFDTPMDLLDQLLPLVQANTICLWLYKSGILRGVLMAKSGIPMIVFGHVPKEWHLSGNTGSLFIYDNLLFVVQKCAS